MTKKIPRFKKGNRDFFVYRCLESEESQDARLWHHSKQYVKIIKKLSTNEVDENDVGFMYKVKFNDGLKYDVFEDELKTLRKSEIHLRGTDATCGETQG